MEGLETVGMTTNGLMLTRRLVELQRAGLDLLNISLDSLRPERFEQITRRKGFHRVIAGIDLAVQLGYKPKVCSLHSLSHTIQVLADTWELVVDREFIILSK